MIKNNNKTKESRRSRLKKNTPAVGDGEFNAELQGIL